MRWITSILLLSVVAAGLFAPAHAETDVLLRAVGFGLTGSDNATVRAVDRAHCVFAIGRDIYHLNNVQVDRLSLKDWDRKNEKGIVVESWRTIELHGDDVVYETTDEPEKIPTEADYGPILGPEMKRSHPEVFNQKPRPPEHHVSKEIILRLATDDGDRVMRAWHHVYANGCVGKRSAF